MGVKGLGLGLGKGVITSVPVGLGLGLGLGLYENGKIHGPEQVVSYVVHGCFWDIWYSH